MNYVLNETRDSPVPVTRTATMVLDGFNAPVSAGCFADLVQKKWYDGMEMQRADGFVVQTGKPAKGEGYVDETGTERRCVILHLLCSNAVVLTTAAQQRPCCNVYHISKTPVAWVM